MPLLQRAALLFAGFTSLCAPAASAHAQQHPSFLERWQARATDTQNHQPHWATPVATATPKLDQSMRTEYARQINSSGYSTWNLGNNKGLELIPSWHTQIIIGVPPFLHHSQPGVAD